MNWVVEFHKDFEPEFDALPKEVRKRIFARISLLEAFGSELGRPNVDTLNGSRHSNMKELSLMQQMVSGLSPLRLTQDGVQY